ncbi:hypothetical protein Taro_042291 [Colocasia esculenta]|uniref:Uncharacterized protein n=1 Tax=Colocasia esculenta TaxID=4460 RepID=A0A843WGG0_COLES|nr:hypothetical protein [Colocasia esculenta]
MLVVGGRTPVDVLVPS